MNLKFWNKQTELPQHIADYLGGSLVTPLESFGLEYADLKALTRKFHPDTGLPVVNEKTLEAACTPMLNPVMVKVERPDYGLMTLSLQHNLRTNAGALWQQKLMGGFTNMGYKSTIKTVAGATATTLIDNANTTWAAGQWEGHIIVAPNNTAITTGQIVYGVIGGNTATTASQGTIYVDQWYDVSSATLASTTFPSATTGAVFAILPMAAPAFWVALTTTAITPDVTHTTLSGEANATGVSRVLGTWATAGAAAYQFTHTWTFTGSSSTTYNAGGLFTGSVPVGAVDSNAAGGGGGVMFLETSLSSSATVSASGDTIAITWTINI